MYEYLSNNIKLKISIKNKRTTVTKTESVLLNPFSTTNNYYLQKKNPIKMKLNI